jgi:hypothetical protein
MLTYRPEAMRRTLTLHVRTAAPVQGKYGPQWELETDVPFSQFPVKFWIDRNLAANEEIADGDYPCILERGDLKLGKTQEGAADFDYKWRIIEFNTDRELPASDEPPPPTSNARAGNKVSTTDKAPAWEDTPQKPDHPSKRRSIERQASLKAAIEYLSGHPSSLDDVTKTADSFYNWIIELPPEPRSDPRPTDTTTPAPNVAPTSSQGAPVAKREASEPLDGVIPRDELPELVTLEMFREQCGARGWDRDRVIELLGGQQPSVWVGDADGRTYRTALWHCIDAEVERRRAPEGIEEESIW